MREKTHLGGNVPGKCHMELTPELSPCTPLRALMFVGVSDLPGPQPLGWKHGLGVGLVPGNTGTEQLADARWLPGSWHGRLK